MRLSNADSSHAGDGRLRPQLSKGNSTAGKSTSTKKQDGKFTGFKGTGSKGQLFRPSKPSKPARSSHFTPLSPASESSSDSDSGSDSADGRSRGRRVQAVRTSLNESAKAAIKHQRRLSKSTPLKRLSTVDIASRRSATSAIKQRLSEHDSASPNASLRAKHLSLAANQRNAEKMLVMDERASFTSRRSTADSLSWPGSRKFNASRRVSKAGSMVEPITRRSSAKSSPFGEAGRNGRRKSLASSVGGYNSSSTSSDSSSNEAEASHRIRFASPWASQQRKPTGSSFTSRRSSSGAGGRRTSSSFGGRRSSSGGGFNRPSSPSRYARLSGVYQQKSENFQRSTSPFMQLKRASSIGGASSLPNANNTSLSNRFSGTGRLSESLGQRVSKLNSQQRTQAAGVAGQIRRSASSSDSDSDSDDNVNDRGWYSHHHHQQQQHRSHPHVRKSVMNKGTGS